MSGGRGQWGWRAVEVLRGGGAGVWGCRRAGGQVPVSQRAGWERGVSAGRFRPQPALNIAGVRRLPAHVTHGEPEVHRVKPPREES